jgi:lipopolysaccharide export LptBFGC system permease protein LptF
VVEFVVHVGLCVAKLAKIRGADASACNQFWEEMVKRWWFGLLLIALCWTGITIVTALIRGEGHGGVFVVSLLVLGLAFAVLLVLLRRVTRMGR